MDVYRKYINPDQSQEMAATPTWGVDILTIGHNIHQPDRIYPDPNHPNQYYFDWEQGRVLHEFQLVYIVNGEGVFESADMAPTLVEGGTAFLLYPNVWHRFRPSEGTGWEEFWVGFKGHYAEYLMRQECFSPQSPLIRMGFNAELLNVFARLIDTLKYEGTAYQQLATCQVIQLLGLVYASALMKEANRTRQERIIHQARYKIQNSWAEAIDFETLANEANVSYIWFRKSFKAVVGVPPGQYQLNLKLEKAGQMLRETPLAISEIAYKTGFESVFYFSKMFKRKVHLTPSEYRRQGLKLKQADAR